MSYGRNSHWFLKTMLLVGIYVFGVCTAGWWQANWEKAKLKVDMKRAEMVENISSPIKVETNRSESARLYVPFVERNDVKYVTVAVNGIAFEALYDTGCGYGMIFSPGDYVKLINSGAISDIKFTDDSKSTIANGQHSKVYHFKIPELTIGDLVFKDQVAGVSSTINFTIVGNPMWSSYKSYVIDNKNHMLVFEK